MSDIPSTPNPDQIAERAWALIELRRWKEAEAEAQRALQLDPRHFEGLYNLATAQWRNGDAKAAEQTARTLISYYPYHASSYKILSRALEDQERFDEAIAAAFETVRFGPNNANSWNRLSRVLISAKLFNDALASTAKVIELEPNDPAGHNNYAIVLEELHRYAEAEVEYLKALELNPIEAIYHANLSGLLRKQKNYGMAAHHAHVAVHLDPTNLGNRSALIFTLGRLDLAGRSMIVVTIVLLLMPLLLLGILLWLGMVLLAWSLFFISLLISVLYFWFLRPRVEAKLLERYLEHRQAKFPAESQLDLR